MLYILATPIGNLSDLSDRAKQVLTKAELLIAENPAYSKRLLDHLAGQGVVISQKKFIQFADYNEESVLPKIMSALRQLQSEGKDAALLSDAGTPGISDPGFRIVRAAVSEGLDISPIPGPSAAITALAASGLPTDKFIFLGFVPKTEIKLAKALSEAKDIGATIIFYESPQRIAKTVGMIAQSWPDSKLAIARELTKIHEEFIRGTALEVADQLKQRPNTKGEMTVVLSFK